MWFSKKQAGKVPCQGAPDNDSVATKQVTTKSRGDAAELAALGCLVDAGLKWVASNYRTPGRGGGEIDLIMRAPDGTLVFVEVRQRASASYGGAAASISGVKQQRIIYAARHYLMRFASPPPCRFDVVLVHGTLSCDQSPAPKIEWLTAAFDAS